MSEKSKDSLEQATFGAGCFWGVEEAFLNTPGVKETEVGFMGGRVENPSYERVCGHDTGHAEVVHLWFDPKEISYEKLLDKFYSIHDPTTPNRQGPDVGDQYRSVIFYYSPEQKSKAEEITEKLGKSGKYSRPIVTAIESAEPFYRAEEYHQKYIAKKGGGSCHV